MKIDFSKPLETVLGEPVKHICSDVVEYKSARICVDENGIVYSSPYIGIQIRNVKEEWNGEGLPSVGTVCEALNGLKDQWLKVKVLDHEGSVPTAACRDDDNRLWWSQDFRPIRTPEQIAAEECDKAVKEMLAEFEHTGSLTSHYEVCEVLHKAGYRKQVNHDL